MLYKVFSPQNLKTLKGQLAKNVFGFLGLKIFSLGLSFVNSIFLSRSLGIADYGIYAYAFVWLSVLRIPATLGFQELIVREVAITQAKNDIKGLRGLLLWANKTIVCVSVAVALAAAAVAFWIVPQGNNSALLAFFLAMLSLPLMALTTLRQATLQGLNKLVLSQIPELAIQPLLFMVLLGGGYFFMPGSIDVVMVMGLQIATVFIAFVVGSITLVRSLPSTFNAVKPDYQNIKAWLRSVVPFILISATILINTRTDAIMLGALIGTKSVGIYTVATRGADLIALAPIVINQAIKPNLAKLYSNASHSQLQRLISKSARIAALSSLPIAFFFICFGYWYLLLFGAEFTDGQTALSLLSMSQLIGAFACCAGLLLSMTGYERETAICVAISAIANIVLNWLLIPIFGMNGAAFATVVSAMLWNGSLSVLAYKRLGIVSNAFGGFLVPHKL
jgi:O-antigen/teichoic acid export membrane protein